MLSLHPTLIGLFAVLCWGIAAPIARLVGNSIGIPAIITMVFGTSGLLGLLYLRKLGRNIPRSVFREPLLYVRWFCFVFHEAAFTIAVVTCSTNNVPFVILLNYLWPTFVLLFSMLIAGLRVTRWWAFLLGTALILISLGTEIAGEQILEGKLFEHAHYRAAYVIVALGAVAWGIYSACTRAYALRTGGGDVVPLFQLTLATALPLSLLFGASVEWSLSAGETFLFFVYCLVLFLAYRAWDVGMRAGNVVVISLGADFIPWLSIGAAAILLSIPLQAHTIISALTLVLGAIVTRFGTLERKRVSR